ncbi:MAG: glycosyltransferase family 2 protein [Archangiaceae bacterium]|nr:glycosyltransferase family 2 protein [Archangiaceae bacterium]
MSAAPEGLSVIVPAHDEAPAIESTVQALRQAVEPLGLPLEIIVVDDGSTDGTAEVARRAQVTVASHPVRAGYGHSLKTGLGLATHDLVAICDADGTYPVEELPAMVEAMARFDMVIGRRTGPNYLRSLLLSPMRTAFLLLTSFVTGSWIPDPNSGFRLFRRRDVMPLLPRLPRAFSFTTTLTLILTLGGRFILYHPIEYRPRIGRSKVRLIRDSLRVGQTLVEVVLEHNPLKLFLVVAAPLGALGTGLLVASAFTALPAMFGTVVLLTSVIVFALGMLAVVVLGADRSTR